MNGWRTGTALGEGARAWRHGRWLSALLTAAATAAFAAAAAADALTAGQIIADEQNWLAAGGHVLIASTSTGAGIPAGACERLNHVDGIAGAAGMSRLEQPVATTAAPAARLALSTATPGLPALLGIPTPAGGLIVGADVADQIGAPPRVLLTTPVPPASLGTAIAPLPATPLPIGAPVDLGMLTDTHAFGLIALTPATGTASVCYVRAEPGAHDAVRALLPAALATPDGATIVVIDRLTRGPFVRDYAAEHAQRPTAYAGLAAGTAVGLMWLLVRWTRRADDGLYTLLGATRPTRTLIRLAELGCVLAVALPLAAITAGWTIMSSGSPLTATWPYLATALIHATAALVAAAIIAASLPPLDPLAATKDR